MKLFVATKGFIEHEGKVLILRESSKYKDGTQATVNKYLIPGGRVEPGEYFAAGLLREIKEETGLRCEIKEPFHVDEWRPIKNGVEWQIVGIYFRCTAASDAVQLNQDHDEYLWIDPATFAQYITIPNVVRAFTAYLNKYAQRN